MIGFSGTETKPDTPLTPQSATGTTYTLDSIQQSFDISNTHYGEISVAESSPSPVEVSFDSGLTWSLILEAGESKGWGTDPVNGVVLGQIRVRGLRTDPIVGVPATWSMTGT